MLHILLCPLSGPDLIYISLLIIFCIIKYMTNKTLNPWILEQVSPVRNPSNISHCADWIFFQDSLFCILCVFSRDAGLEKRCILWVAWCIFPAQMAFSCRRRITFGLIKALQVPETSYSFHISFIYCFSVENLNENLILVSMTYLHTGKPTVVYFL